jgi:hypothetical protein
MWLLDTETQQLRQVVDSTGQEYAILSHTWVEDEEVTFQDMQDLKEGSTISKAGFAKIQWTCRLARARKLQYAWIDTCCIDKTSSAELSEAINSMFRWYKESTVCFVHLNDMDSLLGTASWTASPRPMELLKSRLEQCRWFTRGWTLQELVAPKIMMFYDRNWSFVASKSNTVDILSDITKVDSHVLRDIAALSSVPVGRKMSWAAGRKTTRIEDQAYSLLGLFDINMPLLYGEGPRAFIRLQQQIASETNDLSLFAWQYSREVKDQHESNASYESIAKVSGILARSPDDFADCSGLRNLSHQRDIAQEFSITNCGLRMRDKLYRFKDIRNQEDTAKQAVLDVLLSLDCVKEIDPRRDPYAKRWEPHEGFRWVAVQLIRVGDTYFRRNPSSLILATNRSQFVPATRTVYDRPGNLSGTDLEWGNSHIYIQTILRDEEAKRMSSLLDVGVAITYSKSMVSSDICIGDEYGLPISACETGGSVRDGDSAVYLHANGQDGFVGVHVAVVGRPVAKGRLVTQELGRIAIVCHLSCHKGDIPLLSYGIVDVSSDAKLDISRAIITERGEAEVLKMVREWLLVSHSDIYGQPVLRSMPTTIWPSWVPGALRAKVIDLRHAEWVQPRAHSKRGYEQILVEFHKIDLME